MSDYVETADAKFVVDHDGKLLRGTFPRSWGKPPDDLEARAFWIKERIREGEMRMNRGEVIEGQKPRTGKQALAALKRKRESAAPANHLRVLVHEMNKTGPQ